MLFMLLLTSVQSLSFNILCTMDGLSCPTKSKSKTSYHCSYQSFMFPSPLALLLFFCFGIPSRNPFIPMLWSLIKLVGFVSSYVAYPPYIHYVLSSRTPRACCSLSESTILEIRENSARALFSSA